MSEDCWRSTGTCSGKTGSCTDSLIKWWWQQVDLAVRTRTCRICRETSLTFSRVDMSDRYWYQGQPPHIGWWNASISRQENAWRWWDGFRWSEVAWSHYNSAEALASSERPARLAVHRDIEWTTYYPTKMRREWEINGYA